MAFQSDLSMDRQVATITLSGELDASVAPILRETIEQAAAQQPRRLVFDLHGLSFMASAGLRTLVFARQKMHRDVEIYLVGAQAPVTETIELTGFHHSVTMLDEYVDEYDGTAVS